MNKKLLEKVAYHEAGHAVLSHVLRYHFTYALVNLEKKPAKSLGVCNLRSSKLGRIRFDPSRSLNPNERDRLEANIIISLAGFAADELRRRKNQIQRRPRKRPFYFFDSTNDDSMAYCLSGVMIKIPPFLVCK